MNREELKKWAEQTDYVGNYLHTIRRAVRLLFAETVAEHAKPRYGTPEQVARMLAPLVSTIGIGQLILEGINGKQWVHVSTRPASQPQNRVLTITDAGARAGIHPIG